MLKRLFISIILFFGIILGYAQIDEPENLDVTNDSRSIASAFTSKNEVYGFWTIGREYAFRFPQWGVGYSRLIVQKVNLWGYVNYHRKNVDLGSMIRIYQGGEIGMKKYWRIIPKWNLDFVIDLGYMRAQWLVNMDYVSFTSEETRDLNLVDATFGMSYGKDFLVGIYHDAGWGRIQTTRNTYNSLGVTTETGKYYGGAVVKQFYIQFNYRF